MSEDNDVTKIYQVNPLIENPWRTRQDYIDEQNQAKKQFRLTITALVFSIIASLAAVASAYAAIKALEQIGINSKSVSTESTSHLTRSQKEIRHAKENIFISA